MNIKEWCATSTSSYDNYVTIPCYVDYHARTTSCSKESKESKESEKTKMKEIKNQQVVDLYFSKKFNSLEEERKKKYDSIKEVDRHYIFINSIQKQIDDYITENYDLKNEKYKVSFFTIMTEESKEAIDLLNETYKKEKKELESKKEEILALLSGCERYEQEMMVLNAYGIVSYDDRERLVKMTGQTN